MTVKKKPYCAWFGPQGRRDAFMGEAADRLKEKMRRVVEVLYAQGVRDFGCCEGVGFHLLAAEAVAEFKQEHWDVRLNIILPKTPQDTRFWSEEEKRRSAAMGLEVDVYTGAQTDFGIEELSHGEENLIRAADRAAIWLDEEYEWDAAMRKVLAHFEIPVCDLLQEGEPAFRAEEKPIQSYMPELYWDFLDSDDEF